jgi:lipopolysaccharide/colanic/teichoic acid biosynthesis glycosyltransferase
MLSYYLDRLSINSLDVQELNLNNEFYNEQKRLIYVVNPLNNVNNLQLTIEKLSKQINDNQFILLQFETLRGRLRRIQKKYPKLIANFLIAVDFIVHRILSRILILKNVYHSFSKGKIKIISKAEGLGRLVYSGFQIESVENFNGLCYVLLTKSNKNLTDRKPSFGPIFRMNRVGKNGKIFGVYKIRTMHPYSEFIQDYLIKLNGYGVQGKPNNDFRVTAWGRILRKYWLDEIPQLINVMKFEMKIVGLRPVSEYYFNDLDPILKEQRMAHKPGCIPPYIAFNMASSKNDVLKAEDLYIQMKIKNPYTTDTRLFFMAIKNILFSKKRGS